MESIRAKFIYAPGNPHATMVRIPFLYPKETQHLFRIPLRFDGPHAVLYSVGLYQSPRWWYPDTCSHSIGINDPSLGEESDWDTHRATEGYRVLISRGTGDHRCPIGYENRLASTIYAALATIPTPQLEHRTAPRNRCVGYELRIDAKDIRPRPFARSVEEIVRSLAPDFTLTEFDLAAAHR